MNADEVIVLDSISSKLNPSRSAEASHPKSTHATSTNASTAFRSVALDDGPRPKKHNEVIDLTSFTGENCNTVRPLPRGNLKMDDSDSDDCILIEEKSSSMTPHRNRWKQSSDEDEVQFVGKRKVDVVDEHPRSSKLKRDSEEVSIVRSFNVMSSTLTMEQVIQEAQVIFPRMDPNHIMENLETVERHLPISHKNPFTTAAATSNKHVITRQMFGSLISLLSQSESYPKETRVKPVIEITIDYANDSSYERGPSYKFQSYQQLLSDWPFISKDGMTRILQKYDGRYYKTYMVILDMIKSTKQDIVDQHAEVLRLKRGGRITELYRGVFFVMAGNIKFNIALKHPRKSTNIIQMITDKILIDERKQVDKKWSEWVDQVEKARVLKKARLKAEELGTMVECTCCFGDYAPEEMICCVDGHVFCQDCLRRYAEEQVFGQGGLGGEGRTELKCMCLDGCEGFFSRHQLEKSLDKKVLKKYDELQATLVLNISGLKGLSKCPECDFQAIVPDEEKVFNCVQCGFESCRSCGEEAHIPFKCSEIEKKNETSARLSVEEAMTKARVRFCPKGCKQPFFKVEGCNKMTCPTCKTFICYICRAEIPKSLGYGHFCQKPHCNHSSCQKCVLYSNSEQDDLQAAKEAGLNAIKELQNDGGKKNGEVAKKMEESIMNDSGLKGNQKARQEARQRNPILAPPVQGGPLVRPAHPNVQPARQRQRNRRLAPRTMPRPMPRTQGGP